ncbi:MAG: trypsin-like peptidase domain-containing protein [Planctomycetia bacterium]|nr:trypsin-like peptidase domain-containing protein [Planctomycetia bacterium]
MRPLIAMLLGAALVNSANAQIYEPQAGCASGQCPIAAGSAPANQAIDSRAIVRIVNSRTASRTAGSGTLVDIGGGRGLIITCAHLFREGAGQVEVTFPNQQTYQAQLLKLDAAADLAALSIQAPRIEPVKIAAQFPRPGDWLVSCGYGTDGQLWCNRGQALGYVAIGGGHGSETLELSGAARSGDSGGPVFDRNRELVAVLFGTNGRVVDATFCGRIRQFLTGLSPRFRSPPPDPRAPPQNVPAPVTPEQPLVRVPPPSAPPPVAEPAAADRLAKLEQLVSRINQTWQALNTKIDALAAATQSARQASKAKDDSLPLGPPKLDLPPGMDSIGQSPDPLARVAQPWLSAGLAALLISLGVPGGIAGVAAGAVVWLVMRRAKKRLQDELDRLKGRSGSASTATASSDGRTAEQSAIVERHHNQYVAYEATVLDKAWAAAHAHVGEKYPGAVPYLKIAEGVKDQLLSGNNEPQSS